MPPTPMMALVEGHVVPAAALRLATGACPHPPSSIVRSPRRAACAYVWGVGAGACREQSVLSPTFVGVALGAHRERLTLSPTFVGQALRLSPILVGVEPQDDEGDGSPL